MGTEDPDKLAHPVVLGVEPDPVTRSLIGLYLEPLGYQVRFSLNLEQALHLDHLGEAAVFLAEMTVLSHADPTLAAQLSDRLGNTPVCGLALPEDNRRPADGPLTVRHVLSKPITAQNLLAVLKTVQPDSEPAPDGQEPAEPAVRRDDRLLDGFRALVAELGMDEPFARDLTESFIDRCPQYIGELRQALEQGDRPSLDRVRHALKGMSANLRFDELVALSEQLRQQVVEGAAEEASATVERMADHLEHLRAAIQAYWQDRD